MCICVSSVDFEVAEGTLSELGALTRVVSMVVCFFNAGFMHIFILLELVETGDFSLCIKQFSVTICFVGLPHFHCPPNPGYVCMLHIREVALIFWLQCAKQELLGSVSLCPYLLIFFLILLRSATRVK